MPETLDRLRALRAQLEACQQYGRISMAEALDYAVSSASVVLAAEGRPLKK